MSHSRRCAACKYLRRRCPKDCIFAPYFPPTNLERFVCVHRIFGASNVAKMLQEVAEERRGEAAESMVWEAMTWVRDPVHGSVGIITQLRNQIMEAQFELAKTQALISLFNTQQNHQLVQNSTSFTHTQTQKEARVWDSDFGSDLFWQSEDLEDLDIQNMFVFL